MAIDMICNKKEIGDKPTLEQLTIRIWQKKVNVSAMRMYEYYEKNNWQKKRGEPLKNLDSAIGGFNNIDNFKREPGELREEKRLLQNTDEWKKYSQEVHQYYHNECQRCGKKVIWKFITGIIIMPKGTEGFLPFCLGNIP